MAALFSTTPMVKSGAPITPGPQREFDPEIKDMANYVHSYDIKSDLAVGYHLSMHLHAPTDKP